MLVEIHGDDATDAFLQPDGGKEPPSAATVRDFLDADLARA